MWSSKRYEPFRSKQAGEWSQTFWRPYWGDRMKGYEQVRDELRDGICRFRHLDGVQLVKHAFALRTAANNEQQPVEPVLLYLHAEPDQWPDGRPVPLADIQAHRREIAAFADLVADNEVSFVPLAYRDLLRAWDASPLASVRQHVDAVRRRYRPFDQGRT